MPLTEPLANIATETTLASLKTVADNLLVAANAIKNATEALDTSSIAGTIALDAPSLAALETITANTGGLTDAQLRATAIAVNTGLSQPLTDAQLRAAALNVTISNPTSNITGYATETTLAQVKTALDTIAGNTDTVEALQTAANATLANLAAYNDSVETLLTSLGGNTDGLEALLNTLGVQTDQVEPLLTAIEAKTPALEGGKLPVTDSANAEISELTQEIRQLNETMLYLVSSLLSQQPRLDANNRAAVNVETGSVTVGTISTLTNMTNLNNFAGGNAALVPFYLGDAGATTIYDLIEVTH